MPIRKRGDTWYVDVTAPDGRRIRHSADTTERAAAQEYHDKLKTQLWEAARLGVKPPRYWEEAALRYLTEVENKKSISDDARHIRFWTQHFRGRELASITRNEAGSIIEKAQSNSATRNRYIASLRGLLRKAQNEWEWIDGAPSLKKYKEAGGRIRWLTQEEAERLLTDMPDYMRDMVEFSLQTGLRQANLIELTWDRVDILRRLAFIPAKMFKGDMDYSAPLNSEAVEIIRRRVGKHHTHVFTDALGRSMPEWPTVIHRAWHEQLERARIRNFRWHDLRHTWASWHVQNGTDIYTLKDLGGWKTLQMPMRYAHLSVGHLAHAAERVTKLAQSNVTAQKKKATEVA